MLVGPAIAPFIGGFVSRYLSLRWMQLILAIGAVVAFGLVARWLPETIHPGVSGYEKALSEDSDNDHSITASESELAANGSSKARKRRFVFLNPLTSLYLLRSPVLLLSVRFRPRFCFTSIVPSLSRNPYLDRLPLALSPSLWTTSFWSLSHMFL